MGQLIDGKWEQDALDGKKRASGKFVRADSVFRNWVTADGSAGPTGNGGFKAEAGRYHLYVSYACPWAHRTLIYRALKELDGAIGYSVVNWFMGEHGWTFEKDDKGEGGDELFESDYLFEIYQKANPRYTGRVTVPVLWDKDTGTVVSNESSEIIRMLNTAFVGVSGNDADFYPNDKRPEIDALNERIYHAVNNGVYRTGFAFSQEAYEEAVEELFDTLDMLDDRLASRRFLVGALPTEADWRLLPTLLRFDLVYHGHFKCNRKKLIEYQHLWPYTRDLYQWPGVAETCNFAHMRRHYYHSHKVINPFRIVAIGPDIDWSAPPEREHLE